MRFKCNIVLILWGFFNTKSNGIKELDASKINEECGRYSGNNNMFSKITENAQNKINLAEIEQIADGEDKINSVKIEQNKLMKSYQYKFKMLLYCQVMEILCIPKSTKIDQFDNLVGFKVVQVEVNEFGTDDIDYSKLMEIATVVLTEYHKKIEIYERILKWIQFVMKPQDSEKYENDYNTFKNKIDEIVNFNICTVNDIADLLPSNHLLLNPEDYHINEIKDFEKLFATDEDKIVFFLQQIASTELKIPYDSLIKEKTLYENMIIEISNRDRTLYELNAMQMLSKLDKWYFRKYFIEPDNQIDQSVDRIMQLWKYPFIFFCRAARHIYWKEPLPKEQGYLYLINLIPETESDVRIKVLRLMYSLALYLKFLKAVDDIVNDTKYESNKPTYQKMLQWLYREMNEGVYAESLQTINKLTTTDKAEYIEKRFKELLDHIKKQLDDAGKLEHENSNTEPKINTFYELLNALGENVPQPTTNVEDRKETMIEDGKTEKYMIISLSQLRENAEQEVEELKKHPDFDRMTHTDEFGEENYKSMEQPAVMEQSGWTLFGVLSSVVTEGPVILCNCVAKLLRIK